MHNVMTDAAVKYRKALINSAAGVLAIASLSVVFTAGAVPLGLWWLAVLVASVCGIVLFESVLGFGLGYSPLQSDSLGELTEIAKRTPEVARWASAAVRDGRTLRDRDLNAAEATDRERQEAVARKKAIDVLRTWPGRATSKGSD